jgi:hypothetical protein
VEGDSEFPVSGRHRLHRDGEAVRRPPSTLMRIRSAMTKSLNLGLAIQPALLSVEEVGRNADDNRMRTAGSSDPAYSR